MWNTYNMFTESEQNRKYTKNWATTKHQTTENWATRKFALFINSFPRSRRAILLFLFKCILFSSHFAFPIAVFNPRGTDICIEYAIKTDYNNKIKKEKETKQILCQMNCWLTDKRIFISHYTISTPHEMNTAYHSH